MAGGDNGCGIWLLEVTSNKLVTFPRQNSIPPSASCCWNVTVVITCTVYLVMSTYNYLFFVHSWIVYFVLALILYSGKHSREKTFANWWKIWFCGETFADCLFVLCQRTPCSQISQRKLSQNCEIRKNFLPQKFPAIRYCALSNDCMTGFMSLGVILVLSFVITYSVWLTNAHVVSDIAI